ncbi:Uncharacterised protein [Neisseria meningitidis]|nr:hypothetical protein NM88050_1922 [Neisseria meningitidis 88050]ELK69758.1 hypothetical protein NM63041_1727 [Neisseria meningitidis 63041]ELL01249.1 hypothetical protein NM63049_1910 [Neisseria meningitidis 63049]ELL06412.1 hypothetical protein NM2004090_1988 [Neisseria meningitidis 2004090]ELL06868.1 hypothetical protein NM96023_1891 [Neisseria meningitidis 96023]ELL07215.1 hypothetical protein NM65014_1941 [Neisseria meningitidis 65014]ELL15908.1 hypothetical protein NM97020_0932 [Neiss
MFVGYIFDIIDVQGIYNPVLRSGIEVARVAVVFKDNTIRICLENDSKTLGVPTVKSLISEVRYSGNCAIG